MFEIYFLTFIFQTFLNGELGDIHEMCIASDQQEAMQEMLEERR